MIKIKVNDVDLEVDEGLTVLQACEQAGAEGLASAVEQSPFSQLASHARWPSL